MRSVGLAAALWFSLWMAPSGPRPAPGAEPHPPQEHLFNGSNAAAGADTAAAIARACAAALHPQFLLENLRLLATPQALDGAQMTAVEDWRPAHGVTVEDRSRILFYKTVELELPLTEDGRPISARDLAKARRAVQRAEAGVDAQWNPAETSGRLIQIDGQIVDVGPLLRRFEWRPIGTCEYMSHACVEYQFTPRPGVTVESRAERIMAAMAGRLRLDPFSGQVLQVSFHNVRPVRFGLGLLASFSQIEGEFEMQPAGPGWVWKDTVVHLHGRELWFDKSGTLDKQYLLQRGAQSTHCGGRQGRR